MHRSFSIVALVAVLCIARSLQLSCAPCEDTVCSDDEWSLDCEHGTAYEPCQCCKVCAKGPGEECGGLWGYSGTCGTDLICVAEDGTIIDKPEGVDTRGTCVSNGTHTDE